MKQWTTLLVILALVLQGCAAVGHAPREAGPQRLERTWPARVARACPVRETSMCCFRKRQIREAMRRLSRSLEACHGPDVLPVNVRLRIETQGGAPTCVESAPRDHAAAHCLAAVVAQELTISGSATGERCGFTYPISLR